MVSEGQTTDYYIKKDVTRMLCQHCKQNEATIHFSVLMGHESSKIYLCQNCYRQLNAQYRGQLMNMNRDPYGFSSIEDFFKSISEQMSSSSRPSQTPPTQANGGGPTPPQQGGGSVLQEYGLNLTEEARQGRIDPVIGRDAEITRVIEILNRRTKNNPVLIGEPGVGKTAVAEGLALQIVNGKVPQKLANKEVIQLDVVSLVQGTGIRGQFEERMQALMNEVQQDERIILFIDEVHELVGAGSAGDGNMDAGNILKPGSC